MNNNRFEVVNEVTYRTSHLVLIDFVVELIVAGCRKLGFLLSTRIRI